MWRASGRTATRDAIHFGNTLITTVAYCSCFSNSLRLQVIQSKFFRVIGNYPRRTPNSLHIQPIPILIHRLTDKFFVHCPSHPNPPVLQTVNYSWRIRDQSLFIKFYFTSSMLNMFRTLIHPSSGACDFSIVSPHWLCVLYRWRFFFFCISANYSIYRWMLGVMCLVALLQLVRVFLLVLSVLVFSFQPIKHTAHMRTHNP